MSYNGNGILSRSVRLPAFGESEVWAMSGALCSLNPGRAVLFLTLWGDASLPPGRVASRRINLGTREGRFRDATVC